MIAPNWFLFLVTVFLVTMGLVNILSQVVPANTFRFFFKDILFPIFIIGLIYIVLGAEI